MAKAVDKMERMRKMVGMPKLRVPTYAELLDGSWWAKVGNSLKTRVPIPLVYYCIIVYSVGGQARGGILAG